MAATTEAVSYAQAGMLYLAALRSYNLEEDTPIPLLRPDETNGKKGKSPAFKHKDGKFKAEEATAFFSAPDGRAEKYFIGLRLTRLITIDVDSLELAEGAMRERFPELWSDTVPRQRTKKGYHFVFARDDAVDRAGIVDGARKMWENGVELPVDIKTITSTGTAGILTVWPSPDKVWEVSLLNVKPPPLPKSLLQWIISCFANKRKKPVSVGYVPIAKKAAAAPRHQTGKAMYLLPSGAPFMAAHPPTDAPDLILMGFVEPQSERDVWRSEWDEEGRFLQNYSWHERISPCPLCVKAEGHTSQYKMRYNAHGERYVTNFSSKCRSVMVPHTPAGDAAWRARFEAQCIKMTDRAVRQVEQWATSYSPLLCKYMRRGFTTGTRFYFRDADEYLELYLDEASPPRYTFWLKPRPWISDKKQTAPCFVVREHTVDELIEALHSD